jgi:hypothetical protein
MSCWFVKNATLLTKCSPLSSSLKRPFKWASKFAAWITYPFHPYHPFLVGLCHPMELLQSCTQSSALSRQLRQCFATLCGLLFLCTFVFCIGNRCSVAFGAVNYNKGCVSSNCQLASVLRGPLECGQRISCVWIERFRNWFGIPNSHFSLQSSRLGISSELSKCSHISTRGL